MRRFFANNKRLCTELIILLTAVLAVILLAEPITLRLVVCAIPILGGICLALLAKKNA